MTHTEKGFLSIKHDTYNKSDTSIYIFIHIDTCKNRIERGLRNGNIKVQQNNRILRNIVDLSKRNTHKIRIIHGKTTN